MKDALTVLRELRDELETYGKETARLDDPRGENLGPDFWIGLVAALEFIEDKITELSASDSTAESR